MFKSIVLDRDKKTHDEEFREKELDEEPAMNVVSIDVTKTRAVKEWKHTQPLLGCRVDPKGAWVAAAGQTPVVQCFSVTSMQAVFLPGPDSWAKSVVFHPDGQHLITTDYGGRLHWWLYTEAKPRLERTVAAHQGWTQAVALSKDGQVIATAGNDQRVRLWAMTSGSPLRELVGHACHVYNVGFHPDGQHLVSADLKGVVKQWNWTTGKHVRDFDASVLWKYDGGFQADIGGIRGMAFSTDGKYLACSGITDVSNAFAGVGQAAVALFDWQTGKRLRVLRPQPDFQGVAWGLVFHPSGILIGAGGSYGGGALWFWKIDQERSFFTLATPQPIRDLDLFPDGKQLLTAEGDGALRLYDLTPPAPMPK